MENILPGESFMFSRSHTTPSVADANPVVVACL